MTLRWGIVWAQLDPVKGREQAGARPVLVVSNEGFNQSSGLLTVLPLTTARRAPRRWELLLPKELCGLEADSLLLPQQIRTISKDRLLRVSGRLADPQLRQAVAQRIGLHLGLHNVEHEEQ